MKYTLFLSDFDRTLVREDGTISEKNVEAIHAYRKEGGIFTVVTGRMIASIRPRLLEMGLSDTLVAGYQGAVVARTDTGEKLFENDLPPAECAEILRLLEKKKGLHVQIYSNEVLYSNQEDGFLRYYEHKCGVKGIVEEEPLSEKVEREQLLVPKICIIAEPPEKERLYEELYPILGEKYHVTSSSEYMVEILSQKAQKGNALKYLAGYYQIPLEKVAAIGDQRNDLSMVEAAGGRFAVENAVEELKRIATVVRSNEEDGVAEALSLAMEKV